MHTETLIVGGGLSGISLARTLQDLESSYLLFEARDRLGGRILSESESASQEDRYDLGPAWFWPGQSRIAEAVKRYGLKVFGQFSKGRLVLEEQDGSVQRGLNFSMMDGSIRIAGGVTSLIDAIVNSLPSKNIETGYRLESLKLLKNGVEAEFVGRQGIKKVTANHVVLAIPPRLTQHIQFSPSLSRQQLQVLDSIPTWMAGHAKLIAVYDKPFWREENLSGDGISRRGPLMEIHDASPLSENEGALFGFLGWPAEVRKVKGKEIKAHAIGQLVNMYGKQAASPKAIYFKDWAQDPNTAIQADTAGLAYHPSYGTPRVLTNVWNGRLQFGSTEIANTFGGFLEGALEAAEQVANHLQHVLVGERN